MVFISLKQMHSPEYAGLKLTGLGPPQVPWSTTVSSEMEVAFKQRLLGKSEGTQARSSALMEPYTSIAASTFHSLL